MALNLLAPPRPALARPTRGIVRPRGMSRGWTAAGAFVLYVGVSVVYLALPVLGDGHRYIGVGQDVQIFIWSLRWWPYAIEHGLDPFFTHLVWVPSGADVTWTSSIPAVSLLAAPLTLIAGPTLTWNVVCVLTPSLTAWTAFLLCRRLTGSLSASLAGGFLFGFSSYELASMIGGHVHVALVFLLPLTVHMAIRYVHGEVRPAVMTAYLTGAFTVQFLISPEVCATAIGFGVLTLVGAWTMFGSQRASIAPLRWPVAMALVATAVLVSPVLIHMLAHAPAHPLSAPERNAADLANLVIPSRFTAVGGAQFFSLSHRFAGDGSTRTAYWSLPLVIAIVAYFVSHRRAQLARLLLAVLLVSVIAALGPTLHVGAHAVLPLPDATLAHLPVLSNLAASRMIVYADLAIAIAVSLFLSRGSRRIAKWSLLAAAVVCLLPAAVRWHSTADWTTFIDSRSYAKAIHRGDTILPLPYAYRGDSMRAQAEAGMYFRVMGGATQPTPAAEARLPILTALSTGVHVAEAGASFRRLLASGSVREVVVARSRFSRWAWLLSSLPSTPRTFGDVVVIDVAPSRAR